MSSYNVKPGRLKLRNASIKKKQPVKTLPKAIAVKTAPAGTDAAVDDLSGRDKNTVKTETGSGRLATNGVTVHGFETRFKEEVEPGDVIILQHPRQLTEEEQMVETVLSQRSLVLIKPFSGDVSSTTAFRIRKEAQALRDQIAREAQADSLTDVKAKEVSLRQEFERRMKAKKESGSVVTYRLKTGMWGYKTVTEAVHDEALSREDLLDRRIKKHGRDKFC